MARQRDSRNQLLEETEKQARLLRGEIDRTDSVAGDLGRSLDRNRTQYAEMVREAYRNYRHNNYLTYIFSSRDFADMARKLTNLREVASMRERKLQDIAALSKQVAEEKELLATPAPASGSSPRRRKRPSSAKYRRSSSSTWPSANCAN